jgi:hypothetical protein
MPDHAQKRAFQTAALSAAFGIMLLLVLAWTATVAAQDVNPTPKPTSEFSFNIEPTFQAQADATLDPQMLPSLTGVGARPLSSNVAIRSGPGLEFRRISFLKQDSWVDIVGWNGWEEGRVCSAQFEEDLDMWVQVPVGSGYGWIARCVLDIRGILTDLPVISETGERILQR